MNKNFSPDITHCDIGRKDFIYALIQQVPKLIFGTCCINEVFLGCDCLLQLNHQVTRCNPEVVGVENVEGVETFIVFYQLVATGGM